MSDPSKDPKPKPETEQPPGPDFVAQPNPGGGGTELLPGQAGVEVSAAGEPLPVGDAPRHPRRIPAWAMSMLLHVMVVLLLARWVGSPRGTVEEPDRPVGVAIAHRMPDRTEYESSESTGDADSEQSDEAEAAAAAAAPPSAMAPLDLEGLLADVTETPAPDASVGRKDAIEAAAETSSGLLNDNGGGSPPATTMVFGLSGTGRRFAYVFDRSDSMNGFSGRPLAAAKREIISSLQSLGPDHEFQIIFYNHRPSYFEPSGQSFWMLPADDAMKRRAEAFVRSVPAFGGTEHMDALKMALRLGPDVIFFVTDARIPRLNRRHLDEIHSRSTRAGTTIHAVELGVDKSTPEETFLRTLAHENGGQYRYIDVNTLDPVAAAAEE